MTLQTRSLVVQKFGGTSVGTAERMLKVADIIRLFLLDCFSYNTFINIIPKKKIND
jgi:hypothetical protein